MAGKSTRQSKDKKRSTSRTTRTSKGYEWVPFLPVDHFTDLVGIAFSMSGILTGLAMLPSDHPSLIQPWLDWLVLLFGVGALAVPFAMLGVGVWLLTRGENAPPPPWYRIFGLGLVVLVFLAFMGLLQQWRALGTIANFGGLIGHYTLHILTLAIGPVATPVALLFLGLLGLLSLFELSLAEVARSLHRHYSRHSRRRPRAAPPPPMPAQQEPLFHLQPESPSESQLALPSLSHLWEQTRTWWKGLRVRQQEAEPGGTVAKHTDAQSVPFFPDTSWALPPWQELLEDVPDRESDWEDIRRKTSIIEETLSHFGVPARVVEVNRGPTVTQYGVEPGFVRKRVRGEERAIKVKVSAITNLHNDLALALAAPRIRIEAPVPGHHYVGIEVPNDQASEVTLRGTMETEAFQRLHAPLKVALGRDVMGRAVVADLARMPHLLIAGATGSGKSVCINSLVCCLLCHNTPDQLRLLMVDPKMVELVGYNSIPHLIVPVVTDVERVVGLLRWTVSEMERRYKIFSDAQVRNLHAYNAKLLQQGEKPLPFLVLVIDELADLMMAAADQVESMICRLAQMARATGIHMILATQRPSVDVVTGLIKANFPARIAFAVSSSTDSRVILDVSGAESLMGRGDMLFMSAESSGLRRAQGCSVADEELARLNRFWIEQAENLKRPARSTTTDKARAASPPPMQPVRWEELLEEEVDEEDELLPRARELVAERGRASISMLQRRLRVGYARAARIVDLLEAEGTIGASEGPGKHRDVYIDDPDDV